MKSITLGPNYIMKTLINIFDSILPMFNFENVTIGRRNFGVVPKIEIIKNVHYPYLYLVVHGL
jgi:hypothetical protein